MRIIVNYSSVDGFSRRGVFATLEGARRFAWKWVGENAEVSWTFGYAISDDGIGKVRVKGDATIFDVFPRAGREIRESIEEVDDYPPLPRPEYFEFPGQEDAWRIENQYRAAMRRGPVECSGGCGAEVTNTDGICYECQCRLHALGDFNMDGEGWR